MSLTTPPSPRWNDSDIDYPNISQATDAITCKEWRDDVLNYIDYIHTHCKCRYGECNFGRTKLSKTQKKLGIITGTSLCGHTYLQHFVKEKRYELNNTSWEEINDWYYSDEEDEEDEEDDEEHEEDEDKFLESMQLFRNSRGELTFISKYIESLKNIPIQSI